jgi:hypothetical protein
LIAAYSPPKPNPVERGRRGHDDVPSKRDQKELLAAKLVGEITEEQRAGRSADQVPRCGGGELRVAQPEGGCALERGRDVADDRDFEPVENPGDAEP